MFRKPRDEVNKPDLGRPPSPTQGPGKTPFTLAVPPTVPPPSKPRTMGPTKTRSSKPTPLPTIGRQGLIGSTKKSNPAASKGKQKGNGNILSFFKKEESGLFVEDQSVVNRTQGLQDEHGDGVEGQEDSCDRFNEDVTPSKRRRLSTEGVGTTGDVERGGIATGAERPQPQSQEPATVLRASSRVKLGPFMEASDSEEDEDEHMEAIISVKSKPDEPSMTTFAAPEAAAAANTGPDRQNGLREPAVADIRPRTPPVRPALIKDETSYGAGLEAFKDFEGIDDDFDEDLFEEGDEFMERRYMEEQERLEDEQGRSEDTQAPQETNFGECGGNANVSTAVCPLCSINLGGVSEQDAGIHVNNCLDGNPTPLPEAKKRPSPDPQGKKDDVASAAQYKKIVRPPKPGQQNPFTFGQPSNSGGSAFSKLMSGHAEDAAWAEAAAAEHSSRGKPAYQRTCPFYKIMPGLSICVDAFRYGAVEGSQAYFLSHFHSDHYIGLTSSWSHGPIYCSRVTANLVRQQLRVDSKYVVGLEFEQTVDVPNTRGVKVTMISANHCPGSSLFLFEKVVGKKQNGEPRLQRILHCGDFRACRKHVEHPLLMPNVQDQLTGKDKEQKIDVCYLDTTYLNPKYAFPNQENVIKACADMCVSLSKVSLDESDGWEQMKRQRAGQGMVQFVKRENSEIKEEPEPDGTEKDIKIEPNPNASQQILSSAHDQKTRGRLLVVVGTYSIGKERICLGIARALKSKIYAPAGKQRIVAALEDPELDSLMTRDPREAQVHMTPLFEIRADTLDDYLKDYFPHFTRAVGFRPSGWNYRPPTGRFTDSPAVQTVLYSDNWKSGFSMKDLVPQRGSTSRSSCFGVPYSEHSSFRELTMFCCALKIDKIIPTVNVGSAKSRDRMKGWCERWAAERKKNGVYQLPKDGSW